MLLTIETTHRPATDLGYLLHKNPARAQLLELPFGVAHMFYSAADAERCTFHLMLDLNPVTLVRGGDKAKDGGLLEQYVNDRPYAASSFLSVAIAKALRTALNGRSVERPELAATALPMTATLTPLRARGDHGLLERLFGPLGYAVEAAPIPLDARFPEWGDSGYVKLTLTGTVRLGDLLSHLYVLIPVLDLFKHYYIAAAEIDKLLEKGGEWLRAHPERELIVRRYLRRRRALADDALARLIERDEAESAAGVLDAEEPVDAQASGGDVAELIPEKPRDAAEERLEKPLRLHDVRLDAVTEVLRNSGAQRVADLGCGSGKLLKRLIAEKQFTEILGVDVGIRDLEIAARRLRLDTMPERTRSRIALVQGALTYRDARIEGFDAVALVEVIEHIDPERLAAVERVVFEFAKPATVVVTTPNRDYNVKFEGLPPGSFRHADHRFEWTRAEFADWVNRVASAYGYRARIAPLGDLDEALGAPSQMAVFTRGAP